jgi:prophage regulatory protein
MQDTAVAISATGLLSRKRVLELTGIGRTTLWRYESAGRFPRRFTIGPKRVAWRAKDVADYLADPEAWVAKNGEIAS